MANTKKSVLKNVIGMAKKPAMPMMSAKVMKPMMDKPMMDKPMMPSMPKKPMMPSTSNKGGIMRGLERAKSVGAPGALKKGLLKSVVGKAKKSFI